MLGQTKMRPCRFFGITLTYFVTNYSKYSQESKLIWQTANAYLMKVDAFAWCNALPAWHSRGTTQNQQQFVMPVLLDIPAAAVLGCVTPAVWCHPYLQTPHSFLVMVKLLQEHAASCLLSG